ncbi:MAG: hypothetical protein JWN03_8966 [Nocardia sp.]|nr:hypothetical protein [Nocardia sp.]
MKTRRYQCFSVLQDLLKGVPSAAAHRLSRAPEQFRRTDHNQRGGGNAGARSDHEGCRIALQQSNQLVHIEGAVLPRRGRQDSEDPAGPVHEGCRVRRVLRARATGMIGSKCAKEIGSDDGNRGRPRIGLPDLLVRPHPLTGPRSGARCGRCRHREQGGGDLTAEILRTVGAVRECPEQGRAAQ